MSIITAEKVNKLFGAQQVLRDVTFAVDATDRIGLIGPNGEGKTTLMRIVGGLLEPTSGKVHTRRDLKVGYLPQDPPAPEATTLHEAVLEVFAEVRAAESEMTQLAAEMAGSGENERLIAEYGELESRFETLGGYLYHTKIDQVLSGLGFQRETWGRTVDKLSGGERTRAYLARLLLEEPELLLLDEPTNHLDFDAVEWLESWLAAYRGALVVVSHDRHFLDSVTQHTWEIVEGGLDTFKAPYGGYLTQREERLKERLRTWKAQQDHIAKTEEFIRIHIAGQRSKEAKGRRKRLERFIRDEAVERPRERDTIDVRLRPRERSGELVLVAENLAVGYDPAGPLASAERIEVTRGRRIAVVGPNGIGKTTLLKTILGEVEPLSGTIKHGARVETGYLSQTHAELRERDTALDAVLSARKGATEQEGRNVLGGLLLSGDEALKSVSVLSGGERSRVLLGEIAIQNANFLILDEPTNHLDIPSTEIMQELLRSFDGTLLFVSHDRYLIRAVATHVWALADGRIHVIHGAWDEYMEWRARRAAAVAAAPSAEKLDRREDYHKRRREAGERRRLQRQHEKIEADIAALERELAALYDNISLASEGGDVDAVDRLSAEYSRGEARLKRLLDEWEELGEELG